MTEELKQKAIDFIDRINKEIGGSWFNKYFLSELLVMFANELEKELREKIMNEKCSGCRYNTVGQDEYILVLEEQNKELEDKNEQTKEIIKEILDTPQGWQSGGEWYENEDYNKVISKAEAFLEKVK